MSPVFGAQIEGLDLAQIDDAAFERTMHRSQIKAKGSINHARLAA